ncbi:MAG: GNAT family N-acetyltransferase [Bacteriovoracaceae bacterium]|nr:GNAT family N-acetyltransferase [Bacteriovoracaceae bacterium]
MTKIHRVESLENQERIKLFEMDNDYFPLPWSIESWRSLDLDSYSLFYLFNDKNLIGFALFHTLEGDTLAHLLKICVLPQYRGEGRGKAFLKGLLERLSVLGLEKVFLEVDFENFPAIAIYKDLGFENVHYQENYYGAGRHCFKMILSSL